MNQKVPLYEVGMMEVEEITISSDSEDEEKYDFKDSNKLRKKIMHLSRAQLEELAVDKIIEVIMTHSEAGQLRKKVMEQTILGEKMNTKLKQLQKEFAVLVKASEEWSKSKGTGKKPNVIKFNRSVGAQVDLGEMVLEEKGAEIIEVKDSAPSDASKLFPNENEKDAASGSPFLAPPAPPASSKKASVCIKDKSSSSVKRAISFSDSESENNENVKGAFDKGSGVMELSRPPKKLCRGRDLKTATEVRSTSNDSKINSAKAEGNSSSEKKNEIIDLTADDLDWDAKRTSSRNFEYGGTVSCNQDKPAILEKRGQVKTGVAARYSAVLLNNHKDNQMPQDLPPLPERGVVKGRRPPKLHLNVTLNCLQESLEREFTVTWQNVDEVGVGGGFSEAKSYEMYFHNPRNPNPTEWKLIDGSIQAMALPMACTLSLGMIDFNQLLFIVRGRDAEGIFGDFSNPASVS